jgi:hypothetical protein
MHIGWPSRLDTAERMVNRFKTVIADDNYRHTAKFDVSDVAEINTFKKHHLPLPLKKLD